MPGCYIWLVETNGTQALTGGRGDSNTHSNTEHIAATHTEQRTSATRYHEREQRSTQRHTATQSSDSSTHNNTEQRQQHTQQHRTHRSNAHGGAHNGEHTAMLDEHYVDRTRSVPTARLP